MIYLDTSAFVKLIRGEPETPALQGFLIQHAGTAGRLPDPALRSLDAIHLATALQLQQGLEALVTYGSRLAAAAGRQGLPVVTP